MLKFSRWKLNRPRSVYNSWTETTYRMILIKKINPLNVYLKPYIGTTLVVQWLRICLPGASLVAQWLRICLPMQGTRVRALVWEDPTCHGATRPVSHNY